MIYKKLPITEAEKLMDWAEINGIEYDIWNAAAVFMGSQEVELGLTKWPEIRKSEPVAP